MLVVCAGVPSGEGVGVGEGATVFVVWGCVPAGEALLSGVTVAVGTGLDCKGVTVAVGRGPAGIVDVGAGEISMEICATAPLPKIKVTTAAARGKKGDLVIMVKGSAAHRAVLRLAGIIR